MQRTISFEFFPPQTPEGMDKLRAAWRQLAQLKPAFFSCTFGAGGSTRDRTLETVLEIQSEGLPAAPHLSCIGSTRDNVRAVLARYKAAGIRRIVALRGDLPSGMADPGEFRYANELVEFIRAETGDWFHIEVAAYPEYHPQAKNPREDLLNFKRKVDAGAELVLTQPVYDPAVLDRFLDDVKPLGVPVMVGLLPLASHRNAEFLHNEVPGMRVPDAIRERMRRVGSGPDARKEGVSIAREMLLAVRDRVVGAYVMPPLERWEMALEVIDGAT